MRARSDTRLRTIAVALLVIGIAAAATHRYVGRDTVAKAPVAAAVAATATAVRDAELATRFAQAVTMLRAGEYDYAVVALRRVLELRPDLPEAHVNMGFALLGLNRNTLARDFFLAATDLRPAQANAYWGLAVSLERLCDLRGARTAMQTYVHLGTGDAAFLRRANAALWEWSAVPDSRSDAQNCSSSVEPLSAVTDDSPP